MAVMGMWSMRRRGGSDGQERCHSILTVMYRCRVEMPITGSAAQALDDLTLDYFLQALHTLETILK